ncbi:DUF2207 family protein [Streptohalobacillus salinus]|nr:DUF2207 domain-containing protein [Streptohalobacillus salinus]
MKKIVVAWLTLALFFGLATVVSANEMETLDLEIELHPDGSGTVTETRDMTLDEGTEMYIVMENLGGARITDFQVSDAGEPLTFVEDWDLDWSREQKAGKYGIVETDNGQELVWGIGAYGQHLYTVTYTLTDMVRQLEDGQGMNWRFFNGSGNINPEKVSIVVSGPVAFTAENTKIWGFGFEGEVYLQDGDLVGWSNEPIRDNGHITLLMQFTEPLFSPTSNQELTLSEQEAKAKENSSYNSGSQGMSPTDIVLAIVFGSVALLIVAFIVMVVVLRRRAVKKAEPLVVGKNREQMNEGAYYREVPYTKGPMKNVHFLLQEVNMGSFEDYFSAYILKWLKEGHITHRTETTGKIFKRDNDQFVLATTKLAKDVDALERRFFNVVVEAAGDDGVLEDDEIKKWSKTNYKTLETLKSDLKTTSKKYLFAEGYLYRQEVKFMGGLTAMVTKGTEEGEKLFDHLVQFRNYLKDFSLLDERVVKEVSLWEDLLIWASLYGITEEVAKQLETFYPEFIEQSQISFTDIYVAHLFISSMNSGYSSGVSAASRGGGGGTSFGGGGGSFGGGGGGAR